MLSQLKSFFRKQLGFPSWTVLFIAGCTAHLVLNAALRRPLTSGWGLWAPLTLGVALEAYEIWVRYRDIGLFAPGNDPLAVILGRHAADVLIMFAAPLVLVSSGAVTSREW